MSSKISTVKKALIVSTVFAMICLNGFTQKIKEADVPSAVKASFAITYPGINAKWEKEKENFEAGFKKDGISMSALFLPGGTLLESEMTIKQSELPSTVLSYVKANYKDKKIRESAKITRPDGPVTYEAEVEGKDLIFDSNGKFLKEVKD